MYFILILIFFFLKDHFYLRFSQFLFSVFGMVKKKIEKIFCLIIKSFKFYN
jgi:hypothetical protein